jgi:hypothetical protein
VSSAGSPLESTRQAAVPAVARTSSESTRRTARDYGQSPVSSTSKV